MANPRPIRIVVTVDLEHVSGKFAGRADLIDEICQVIESADPGSFQDITNENEYAVSNWTVEEESR